MKTRIVRTFLAAGAAALLCAAATAAPVPEKGKASAEDVTKGEKAVKEYLEKIKGDYGTITHVKDDALERSLPNQLFFAVLYRQYPVGRVPPQGLKASNVFVVEADGKVKALTDPKGLEEFCKSAWAGIKDEKQAKDAVRAWLRLSQEFRQDGFYKFALMDDSTKVESDKGLVASGKVVVMQGGNGELNATLYFDGAGKLVKVEEESKIKPGPRPICQATKLLDPDPIVRRMAEQDLLVMGRAARPYLDEQRAKASPELQKAIDRLWQRIVEEDR